MEGLITRNNYLDAIRPFTDKQLIKVLTGQRRVGKSVIEVYYPRDKGTAT